MPAAHEEALTAFRALRFHREQGKGENMEQNTSSHNAQETVTPAPVSSTEPAEFIEIRLLDKIETVKLKHVDG
ncbi:hypothetical protein [Streptomyces fragilis]|uniref:Uncharacterized protein n=1 Tax=Streptomyces fragilis TaxID=67301 RepID=A0ABV2YDC6_9ACTN|nr:hypothetical protein [Streptomyces fragilis]